MSGGPAAAGAAGDQPPRRLLEVSMDDVAVEPLLAGLATEYAARYGGYEVAAS